MLLFSSSKANFSQQRQTSFKITVFQEAAGRAALQRQQSQGQPQGRAGQGRAEQSRAEEAVSPAGAVCPQRSRATRPSP